MSHLVNRWVNVAGLLALPFYLTLILVLGALEPGFNHRTSLMSLLGGAPGLRGLAFNLGVGATGILIIIFALGLRRRLPTKWTTKIGFTFLLIGGLGLIGAGIFHCDQGCRNVLTQPNLVGRLHTFASLLAGMGTGLAVIFFWAAMRRSEKWKGLTTATLIAAVMANLPGITLWITLFTGLRLYAVEGLIQRMGFIVVLTWIFLVAARARLS